MKFVCERCHTRYSIADDKVRQKILKIRCKTCENVITVRDPGPSAADAGATPGAGAGPRVPPPAPKPTVVPPTVREWFVAVNGEQTGPLTRADAARRVLEGKHDDEIYIWRDGLDGWKAPSEVPAIHQEVNALRGRHSSGPVPRLPPPPRQPTGKAPVRAPTPATGRATGRNVPVSPAAAAKPAHGGRGAPAAASLAQADPFGDEDRTQISPFDAAMIGGDMVAKGAGSVLPFKGKGKGRVSNGSGAVAMQPPAGLDGLFSDMPSGAHGPGAFAPQSTYGGVPRAESGLSRLHGVPGFLSRNPSLKFIAAAAVVLVLIGLVVVVLVLPNDQKPVASALPSRPKPLGGEVSEAKARAEAEQRFKATVPEPPPPPARPVAADSRRPAKPTRPATHAAARPALEPSPLTPDQAAGKVAQQGERKVTEYRSARGSAGPVGGPSDQMIAAVVKKRENQAAIKTCYERALKRDDRLRSGRIDVSASVGMSGIVKAVDLHGPPEFVTVESCIRTAVRRWSFPVNSEEYKIEFPLILQGNL